MTMQPIIMIMYWGKYLIFLVKQNLFSFIYQTMGKKSMITGIQEEELLVVLMQIYLGISMIYLSLFGTRISLNKNIWMLSIGSKHL